MIVRLNELVLALLVSRQLEGDIGKHFVCIHVGRGPGAALVPIDAKLIVVLSIEHGLAGLFDGSQGLLLHGANVCIRPRRGQLDHGPRLDKSRIVVDLYAGDLKIFESAGGLNAVVDVRRDGLLPQQVLLDADRLLGGNTWDHQQTDGGCQNGKCMSCHENPSGHPRSNRPRSVAASQEVAVDTNPGSMKLWLSKYFPIRVVPV